jgi:hypothetical protein
VRKDYVTKDEFEKFRDVDFQGLKTEVSNLKDSVTGVRIEVADLRCEMRVVGTKVDHLQRWMAVRSIGIVLPTLLLMYQILCDR